jgi:hypothetical protein
VHRVGAFAFLACADLVENDGDEHAPLMRRDDGCDDARLGETTVPPWCYCGMESDAHMNLRALAINEEVLKSLEECIKELDECIKKTEEQLHQLESAMGDR